ncbi:MULTISPECIES: RNA polymerase sigma factor [unclassified Agrococcus]|uniref:RNA polymerase sigma factor n=1 Tax=unclassified Agrococcus TaxID=2615065 RepID=UPI0036061239
MTLELHETAAIRAVLSDEWDALQPRLTAIAQRVVRRREIAEEVVSSTVVELIERVDAGETIRDPAAYLARGVRFRAIDVVRSRDGQAVVGTDVADDAIASIADARLGAMSVDDLDALSPVREAFGALSQRHREVLLRTVVDGEAMRDVARGWGMSANAVSVLALRARKALRGELKAVLQERAGGACAVHARSSDRAALAHVARCAHCLDVRAGRGVGRWVFATVPLLLGGAAAAVSPPSVAQALVGSALRKPVLAASSMAGVAAATAVVVVTVATLAAPVERPVADAPPAAAAPEPVVPGAMAQPAHPEVSTQASDAAQDAAQTAAIGPRASAPVVASPTVVPTTVREPAIAGLAVPLRTTPLPGATLPDPPSAPRPAREPAPPLVDPEPPVTEPEPPVTEPEPPTVEPEPPVTEPEPPITEPEPPTVEPEPPITEPQRPVAAPTVAVDWSAGLGVLPIATIVLSGLVPGESYSVALTSPLPLTLVGVSGGLSCQTVLPSGAASCVAEAESAVVTIVATGALLCALPATLTVAAADAGRQDALVADVAPPFCL